jgi:hypothetical protein
MNRIAISRAASALMRALVARSGAPRDRILLSDARSTDWQSLTFTGEHHQLQFRIPAPRSAAFADKMCAGLEDAEFSLPGVVVADIAIIGRPCTGFDGSTTVAIEALTIAAD